MYNHDETPQFVRYGLGYDMGLPEPDNCEKGKECQQYVKENLNININIIININKDLPLETVSCTHNSHSWAR